MNLSEIFETMKKLPKSKLKELDKLTLWKLLSNESRKNLEKAYEILADAGFDVTMIEHQIFHKGTQRRIQLYLIKSGRKYSRKDKRWFKPTT